jgi:hypothetical protein
VPAEVEHRRHRVSEPRDVLERIEDRDPSGNVARHESVVQRDLVDATHEKVGRLNNQDDRYRQEMQKRSRRELPGSVARRDGVQIHDRAEHPRHQLRYPEKVRVDADEARRVVHARREIERKRRHEHGEQAVGRAVLSLRDEDAGEEEALQGANDRGELEPVERETRHAENIPPTASRARATKPSSLWLDDHANGTGR